VGAYVRYKLGDLLEIKHGFAFKGEFFSDEGSLILLTPGNFKENGGLKLKGEKEKYYTGIYPEEFLLKQGDMLIAMTDLIQSAPILGSPAWIPENNRFLHNQRLGKVVNLKTDKALPEYLYYLFNTSAVRNHIKGSATGSTVRHTAPSRLYDISVHLPPVSAQRRIAAVLSAYDDLIENSQRRIWILETMARALYWEWFVKFLFPGHEKVKRVVSALGEIPVGWEIKPIQDFGRVITGKTPSKATAAYYGNEIPFLKTPDMHGNMFILGTTDRLSFLGAQSQGNKTLPTGSICVSCIGTIGIVGITTQDCQTNQQINSVVLSDPASREFLFFRLQDAKQRLENLGASGATMGNVSKGKFEAMEFVCPPSALLSNYHRRVGPIFSRILCLLRQMQNLRQTRDLLLPRLLSGQISLKAA
jgi:type I restriction enzyme S subunit